jgi:hypothetical protein
MILKYSTPKVKSALFINDGGRINLYEDYSRSDRYENARATKYEINLGRKHYESLIPELKLMPLYLSQLSRMIR